MNILLNKVLYSKVWLNGLKCGITPFTFFVFDPKPFGIEERLSHDWSKEWIMHLIDIRGQEYVSDLKLWLRNQKSLIKSDYAQEKNLLVRKLKELEAPHTQESNSLVAQLRELEQRKIVQLRELDAIGEYATNNAGI